MTTTVKKKKIAEAVASTGLEETRVKLKVLSQMVFCRGHPKRWAVNATEHLTAEEKGNMKRLEELGCPSVWLGYSGIPERLYSPSMADLAENEVFTNFVVSAMVNQQDLAGRTGPSTSTSTSNSDPVPCVFTEGDHVEILDDGRRVVGEGTVTGQNIVHGRKLTDEWVPVLVKEITSTIRPWQEYPTHSGQVENNSFIAWPVNHLRRKTRIRVTELDSLKDRATS
ncbi:hypothetical protein OS493_025874 [Desmophyllum pertusum]|uniref:Uncharacterized protein n=1 Tax=Desmophyllum pertusum TaxID=174260 RepID=A0A9W9YXY6_9CNID|nr:hypothetical protein OS493_025874 [Desmophyllum pertusum]